MLLFLTQYSHYFRLIFFLCLPPFPSASFPPSHCLTTSPSLPELLFCINHSFLSHLASYLLTPPFHSYPHSMHYALPPPISVSNLFIRFHFHDFRFLHQLSPGSKCSIPHATLVSCLFLFLYMPLLLSLL